MLKAVEDEQRLLGTQEIDEPLLRVQLSRRCLRAGEKSFGHRLVKASPSVFILRCHEPHSVVAPTTRPGDSHSPEPDLNRQPCLADAPGPEQADQPAVRGVEELLEGRNLALAAIKRRDLSRQVVADERRARRLTCASRPPQAGCQPGGLGGRRRLELGGKNPPALLELSQSGR